LKKFLVRKTYQPVTVEFLVWPQVFHIGALVL
jgi:hypothetical protein